MSVTWALLLSKDKDVENWAERLGTYHQGFISSSMNLGTMDFKWLLEGHRQGMSGVSINHNFVVVLEIINIY